MSRLLSTFTTAFVTLSLAASVAANAQSAAPGVARPPAAVRTAVASAPLIVTEDASVTKRAMEWFGRLQSGDVDRTQLTPTISAKLTPLALATMRRQLTPLGAPTGIAFGGAKLLNGELVYRYVVVFPIGAIQEFVSLDKTGKISGILFLPVR